MENERNIAIKVNNLSKKYKLGGVSSRSFRQLLNQLFHKKKEIKDEFWAVKDVSFELSKGEVLGVIGRNGAGKSTLLKLLSKITSPTEGRIEIFGRIASLLEVGTGFHPELSGRENIYLNGTILGMSRSEVKSKFDEIVDFSGVGNFIDTPVKRYSSGMYVRLAFSVAAHLEPEILIIDEVLAVGDFEFQKKCLGKMEEVAKEGRTVIFVSHNLTAVRNLCTRVIVLNKGKVGINSDVNTAIDYYQNIEKEIGKNIDLQSDIILREKGRNDLALKSIIFGNQPFSQGEQLNFELIISNNTKDTFNDVEIGVNIVDKNENCVIHISNKYLGQNMQCGVGQTTFKISVENKMKSGTYKVRLFLRNKMDIQDWIMDGLYFEIEDGNPYGYNVSSEIQGSVLPEFSIEKL